MTSSAKPSTTLPPKWTQSGSSLFYLSIWEVICTIAAGMKCRFICLRDYLVFWCGSFFEDETLWFPSLIRAGLLSPHHGVSLLGFFQALHSIPVLGPVAHCASNSWVLFFVISFGLNSLLQSLFPAPDFALNTKTYNLRPVWISPGTWTTTKARVLSPSSASVWALLTSVHNSCSTQDGRMSWPPLDEGDTPSFFFTVYPHPRQPLPQ